MFRNDFIQKNKLNLSLLVIVGAIISTPFIYAVVEPHIIIQMTASQTTSPFLIENSTGFDVLEIDPDGNVNGAYTHVYKSGESTVHSVAVGNTISNPIVLYRAEVDRSALTDGNLLISSNDPTVVVQLRRDSGTGTCSFGWFQLVSGSWSNRASSGGTSAAYSDISTSTGEGYWAQDMTAIGLILYNSDGATTCSFKNISAYVESVWPASVTWYRSV